MSTADDAPPAPDAPPSAQAPDEQPEFPGDDSPIAEAEPPEPPPAGAVELPFQAEVQQVLALVINSLYTHKEVFLRELISNASDALDKARYLALTRKDVREQEGSATVSIRLDESNHTLTIEDNGIGMTREEVIQNLGTIAKSGSLEFLKANAEARTGDKTRDQSKDVSLIGQFGVGFYAAFMVASRVDVKTLSMLPGSEPILWRSAGSGSFTLAPGDRAHPGTEIIVHLQADQHEYDKAWRVKELVRKYSDFVHFPIALQGETINRSAAIWALPKAQVTDEQHAEFFQYLTNGVEGDAPLLRIHYAVDAPVQFHALMYVPAKLPPEMFRRDKGGLRLYARRVLITEQSEKLLPSYLRFVRGVVDSEDLSLNVSREMLQEDRTLQQIEQQLTKQVLRALKELAESDADRYATLWNEFGKILKEGFTTDWKNRDALAELCRFESMKTEPGKLVSFKQYLAAMPEGQKEIFYVTGRGRAAVEQSPHLEAFKKRGYDVLFLVDPIDEWVIREITEHDKRKLKSVAHGDLDLGEESPEAKEKDAAATADTTAAVAAVKAALGARVKDVRVSKRLTDSASVLVAEEGDPGVNFERILKMIDRKVEESKRILELNPDHPIVKNLEVLAKRDPASPRVARWAELLFDQALLAEGVVEDPAKLVRSLQELLTEVSAAAVAAQPAAAKE